MGQLIMMEMKGYKKHIAPDFINQTDTLRFFLKILNQETNAKNYRMLFEPNEYKSFGSDVWNGTMVQFHASFSLASRQFI